MSRILWDPFSGSIKRVSLKLLDLPTTHTKHLK